MKINEITKNNNVVENLSLLPEEDIVKTLKKDCDDIIKIYKNTKKLIFRGEKKDLLFFKKKYPTNRVPRDTNIYFHKIINYVFKKKGFIANRSNSVFTTSQINIANSYGNPYVFFPKNGYHYVWGSDVFDLYFDISNIIRNINNKNNNIYGFNGFFYKLKPSKREEDVLSKINDYLKYNNITLDRFDNLKSFFIYFNEKYILLDSLQKRNFSSIILEFFDSITEKDNEINEIFEEISKKYKNNDLHEAINSGNEILFTDEFFYMLNYNEILFNKNKYPILSDFLAFLLGINKSKLTIN